MEGEREISSSFRLPSEKEEASPPQSTHSRWGGNERLPSLRASQNCSKGEAFLFFLHSPTLPRPRNRSRPCSGHAGENCQLYSRPPLPNCAFARIISRATAAKNIRQKCALNRASGTLFSQGRNRSCIPRGKRSGRGGKGTGAFSSGPPGGRGDGKG